MRRGFQTATRNCHSPRTSVDSALDATRASVARFSQPSLAASLTCHSDSDSPIPLYELGNTIGEGGTSVVVSGERGGSASPANIQRGAFGSSRDLRGKRGDPGGLAVKVIRKDANGQSTADGELSRSSSAQRCCRASTGPIAYHRRDCDTHIRIPPLLPSLCVQLSGL